MASSSRIFGLPNSIVEAAIAVAAIAIALGTLGGYWLGKNAAITDNARDEVLRQSMN